ncbi:hypothetical protein OHB14_56125 [Streptomyces sp. NBC_01613]|uniref:hypothetical protein n=1 Tax=Streptomyces sp. NBC_01613 TaxID=2975896 RepID=UPI00386DAE3D
MTAGVHAADTLARATAQQPRARILLAPVPVSPTKPLTPTHLKYLLSLDMLHRATATFADVTFVYHHTAFAGSRQVAGFWEYLDRCHPGAAHEALSEEAIGELYTAYNRAGPAPEADLLPVVRRAEAGWTHPVTARLLDIWEGHYRLLGMADPGLGRTGPEPASEAAVLDLLVSRNLCIDARGLRAPAYLDATAAGLPLRAVTSPDGQANYLLYLLRQLVPLLDSHDLVVLAHDVDLRTDYQTLAHVFTALGATVVRFEVPRVPIDGVVRSTRFGGWQGHTLGAFAGALVDEFGPEAFQLGLRLYLVAGLGRTARSSFSLGHLRRWMRRAVRLLDESGGPLPPAGSEHGTAGRFLAARAGRRRYADPYLLATTLLGRDPAVPAGELLRVVMGSLPDRGAPTDMER